MKILIIEDEKLLADSLEELLKTKEFETQTVYDGKSGLEYALLGIYDLLILDVMLPGLNGFQVAKKLRAEKCGTPILMLTARSGLEDRIEGLDAGADYYLAKPFDSRELLQSPEYSADAKNRFSDNILTMAGQMRTLVEGLLDLSRADNGSMQLAMEPLDLRTFIERELCLFEPLYFEHSLTLNCELADDVWINGSPTHFKQVLDILLDNALKYGDPDSEVLVRLEKQHHHCLLSVTSHGQTIAPADLKRIFQRFYRINQSRTRSGSYGLGLSIAEGIVRKHHGKIWAESTDGRNTFFVQLKASPGTLKRTS